MVEFTGMLPSTDNLFKFLFISGLLMIFTAMFYPMQKRQLLDIETLSYNKEVDLLNYEINVLSQEVKKLKALDSTAVRDLRRLQYHRDHAKTPAEKAKYALQFANLKTQYLTSYSAAEKKLSESNIKKIVLGFNEKKLVLLQKHAQEYQDYVLWFLSFGIPLSLIGIFGWGYSTYKVMFGSNP